MTGKWAVCFKTHATAEDIRSISNDEKITVGPDDMSEQGFLIAKEQTNYGIIGDYCLMGSRKAEFSYVALTRVEGFAVK